MTPKKIFQKDENCIYVWCNEHYATDLKIKPEEIVGKRDVDFYPKSLADKYCSDDLEVMRSGVTIDTEEEYVIGGEKSWVHTIKSPILDKRGGVVGVLGVFWDTTKERKLKESSERLQDLANNLNVSLYTNTAGPKGRFLEVNDAMVNLFEADSKEQMLKINVSDLYADSLGRKRFSEKLLKQGFVKGEELKLKTLKGNIIYATVFAVAQKNEKGETYFNGFIQDITPRKTAEEQLKNKLEELERLNKSMVGRELKMIELKKDLRKIKDKQKQ